MPIDQTQDTPTSAENTRESTSSANADPDDVDPKDDPGEKNKKIAKAVKEDLAPCRKVKKNLHNEWRRNIELRLGHIATNFTGGLNIEDEVQTQLNPDWSLTNTKVANLFSQVPVVLGTHENKQYAGAVGPFIKSLNFEIGQKRGDVGTSMEEVLNDVVNAAGIGAILVGYNARTEDKMMPVEDQVQIPGMPQPVMTKQLNDQQLEKLAKLQLVHMQPQTFVISDEFYMMRISPNDLLWPATFMASDFNKANWNGYDGVATWADAKHMFKLKDEDKGKIISGSSAKKETDDLRVQPNKDAAFGDDMVRYTRIFYWRARFDEEEKYLNRIWELVYVDGIEEPVLHQAWGGQRVAKDTNKLVGCMVMPLQFLTLTYVTDNPVVPSDSSAGRPQVNDLRRSRDMLFKQRQRNVPLRWYDPNRLSRIVAATIQRGEQLDMIPTAGVGDRAMGQIAPATYPPEDFTFDQITYADLRDVYGIDPVQMSGQAPGRQNSAATQAAAQARATRGGREKTRVSKFFLRICEAVAGLMILYGEFPNLTDQEKQQMQQIWDMKHVVAEIALKIRPNSMVVPEAAQRQQELVQVLNMTVKSGFVNPKPIVTELIEWYNIDPADVIVDPQPKKPDDPNISMRLSGKDDLNDPKIAAMLMKHDQFPNEQQIVAAKKLLAKAQRPVEEDIAEELEQQARQGMASIPGQGQPQPPRPGAPMRPVAGAPHGEAHPDWKLGSRVAKRSRDVSGG